MKRMKMCAIFACCLTLLLALAACGGSSGYEGTWRMEDDGFDLQLELGKDGQALYYDALHDQLFPGSWEETEEGVTATFDTIVPLRFELTADGEDILRQEMAGISFVRAKGLEVPRVTISYLYQYYWVDAETDTELEFDDDGSWELLDDESDTIDVGSEGSVEIDGYNITLTSRNGKTTKLKLSEDRTQITGYEDMAFARIEIPRPEYSGDEGGNDEDDGGDAVENVGVDPAEFYGCWEYEDYDVWVDILTDGTYQWMNGYELTSGSYTIEEDELVLDSGLRFSLDESGGLIDSDGDTLFPSTWPDSEVEPAPQVTVADFVGCWEYTAYDNWICIFGEGSSSGTYDWYQIDGLESSGSCYMDGETLYLKGINLALTLDGEGGLIDSDGDALFRSQLPDDVSGAATLSAA